MNIKVYLTRPEPRAQLTLYAPTEDGSKIASEHTAATLDEVVKDAGLNLGSMNEAYEELAALGVPEVLLISYGKGGMSAYGGEDGVSWQAFWRHPQNSGMGSHTTGRSARAALAAAAQMESERQRENLVRAAEYHEREAARLREELRS